MLELEWYITDIDKAIEIIIDLEEIRMQGWI